MMIIMKLILEKTITSELKELSLGNPKHVGFENDSAHKESHHRDMPSRYNDSTVLVCTGHQLVMILGTQMIGSLVRQTTGARTRDHIMIVRGVPSGISIPSSE